MTLTTLLLISLMLFNNVSPLPLGGNMCVGHDAIPGQSGNWWRGSKRLGSTSGIPFVQHVLPKSHIIM
jgi:hypothetical protein